MTENTPEPKTSKTRKAKIIAGASIAIPVMVAGLLLDDQVKKFKARKDSDKNTPDE